MEFIFRLTKIDPEQKQEQVSHLLKMQMELLRKKRPANLNKITGKEEPEKKPIYILSKKKIAKIFLLGGIVLSSVGFFQENMILFFIGLIFALFSMSGLLLDNSKEKLFARMAQNMLKELEVEDGVEVRISKQGITLPGAMTIDFEKMEYILFTKDLIGILADKAIIILQKKDLATLDMDIFIQWVKEQLPPQNIVGEALE